MSKKLLQAYVMGVTTAVIGGAVAKWLNEGAGGALVLAATYFLGMLKEQPRAVRGAKDEDGP